MKLKTKEELWKKADELIASGYSGPEIGKQLGVSHVAVHKYLKRSGKHEEWKEKRMGAEVRDLSMEEYQQIFPTPDNLEKAVLEAVRQYETVNSNELHRKVGLGRNIVAEILQRHRISYKQNISRPIFIVQADAEIYLGLEPKGDYSEKERESVLGCVLEDKPITIYQIRQKTGIEDRTVLNILKDEKLVTFIPPQRKRRPELDELIAKGLTEEIISQEVGVTTSRVGQYIHATGQHDYWMEQKEKRKAEKLEQENALHQARQDLTSLLVARAYQRTDEGGWKYRRKALDYHYGGLKGKARKYKTKDVSTPLEKLLTLFETYEMAERLGVKLSLNELEEKTGIQFPHIGRILSSQGLEPLYGTKKRSSSLTLEKNQAIDNGYRLGFTSTDVAYFLGLDKNLWIVTQHFIEIKRSGAKKISRDSWLFRTKQRHFGIGRQKGDLLFYRTASQIYELDDLAKAERINFSDEEVAKLLEIRPVCVEYARKNRGCIEYDIKLLLRVLYPNKKVEKPYL